MSTRLVILGLLKDKALYGYEIKHIIEKHMGDWTSIAFGSIYFALNKLNDEGYVEQDTVEKVGNRPARSVYKITEKGRKEYLNLLRKVWQTIDREYYPLDIALAFSYDLPKDEVKNHILNRIMHLENALKHIKEHKKEQLGRKNIPKTAEYVFTHSEYHIQAEYNWLKSLLKDFTE